MLISIHARREGSDLWSRWAEVARVISIHALREEGDAYTVEEAKAIIISIHALREEGDLLMLLPSHSACNFYPRPPRGGRRL